MNVSLFSEYGIAKSAHSWNNVALGEILEQCQYGLSVVSDGSQTPMLGMKNLVAGKVVMNGSPFIDLDPKILAAFLLKPGDLLFNRTNSYDLVGKTAIFTSMYEAVFASYLVRLRVRPEYALPQFINYCLNTNHYQALIKKLATPGVSQYNINPTQLRKRIYLSLPPLPEQRRIVEILDEADAAVRLTEALIAAKLRHKHAWAERLLTGQVRFPKFAGEAWQEMKLSEVLRESRTPAKASHPGARLTVRLHTEGVEARKDRGTEVEEATVYYQRRAGQFIYGKQNLHRGAVGIIPDRLDGYSSSQDVPAFDWLTGADPAFLLACFSRKPFYEKLERLATGTGSKRIHPAAFLSVSLPVPPLTEQRKIEEVLGLMDEEIALRRRQLTALKAQKQGLMQKLLTGEVRVKEAAP